jgi:hypothetical protein
LSFFRRRRRRAELAAVRSHVRAITRKRLLCGGCGERPATQFVEWRKPRNSPDNRLGINVCDDCAASLVPNAARSYPLAKPFDQETTR